MSLAIDVDRVASVLIADSWYAVADSSFTLDSYEYLWDGAAVLGGGQDPLLPAIGFEFTESSGYVMAGPLTAILAVRYKPR